jgi:hypothetical protein
MIIVEYGADSKARDGDDNNGNFSETHASDAK